MKRLSGALVAARRTGVDDGSGRGNRRRHAHGWRGSRRECRHGKRDRPADARSALDVREDEAGNGQEDRLLQQHGEVVPRPADQLCATTSSSGCKANAPEAKVTGEVRHFAERRRRAAQRHEPRNDRFRADGQEGAVRRHLPAARCERSRSGLDQRDRRPGHRPAVPRTPAQGVKVGIIDTGIDVDAPLLRRRGLPGAACSSVTSDFTNNKVIVAKVFNNQSNRFDHTPEAKQEHGTHVAGTVACNLDTPATVSACRYSVRRFRRCASRAARELQRLPR